MLTHRDTDIYEDYVLGKVIHKTIATIPVTF